MKDLENGVSATRKDSLIVHDFDDEVLVYDPETTRTSCLNSFAAEVLALCDGQRSASDITRDLPLEDVDERLVWLALSDLQEAQLLEDRVVVPFDARGHTSRRDLLRQIGAGSAVAIPVVAGITLPPTAAHASHGPCHEEGQSCNSAGDCCPPSAGEGVECDNNICVFFELPS